MSIFNKLKKKGQNANTVNTLNTEENAKIDRMQEQIQHLNRYIQELVKENESLQRKNNDLRVSMQENKTMLGKTNHKLTFYR